MVETTIWLTKQGGKLSCMIKNNHMITMVCSVLKATTVLYCTRILYTHCTVLNSTGDSESRVLLLVFCYLNTAELCTASRVSRRWYTVSRYPLLWRTVTITETAIPPEVGPTPMGWSFTFSGTSSHSSSTPLLLHTHTGAQQHGQMVYPHGEDHTSWWGRLIPNAGPALPSSSGHSGPLYRRPPATLGLGTNLLYSFFSLPSLLSFP